MLKKGDFLVREYRKSDYEELVSLWQICFGDERDFIESFFVSFKDRMKAFVYEEDEKVVSAVYLLPSKICVKKELDAWYLYAVSTLPGYRKRGFASNIINYIKKLDDGKTILFLTPSSEENRLFYKSLSFEDKFINYEYKYCYEKANCDVKLEKMTGDISKIRNSLLKENFVKWDKEHISFSFDENLFLIKNGEKISGYLHFKKDNGEISVDEIIADEKDISSALSQLCKMLNIKNIKVMSNKGNEYCKKYKGMIYYKFDSICDIMSKNDFYLGINME